MYCRRRAWALLCVCLCALGFNHLQPLSAATIIHFDQDTYFVNGPGDVINAQVLIDANDAVAGDTPVRGGLFSFGVSADYPVAKASLNNVSQIHVSPELEHFGFDGSAFRDIQPGLASVKGNVDSNTVPTVPYEGTWLATFDLTNLATGPDSYPLGLDFFRTVGVNEQIFVDGNGLSLDDSIVFIPSRVVIVPEPNTLAAWPIVLGIAAVVRRRVSRQCGSALRRMNWHAPRQLKE